MAQGRINGTEVLRKTVLSRSKFLNKILMSTWRLLMDSTT